jgi:hypothetical protein
MKEIVNIPYKSRWIGRMFITITAFTALVFILVYYYVGLESSSEHVFVNAIMLGTFSMILIVTGSFYNTKYRIKDGMLTSWSPFMFIKIKLKDIRSVEKIMFPFGFRVGASLYCGVYYIPSLGWARVIITNLRDVILIRTKDGRKYIISPKNPKIFMKQLKK